MIIYSPQNTAIYDAPITTSAIIKNVLMGDYYIELPFNTREQILFSRGSYILYKGYKFKIKDEVNPDFDASTGGWKYTLRFWARQNDMKDVRVKWTKETPAELIFNDTTDLRSFGNIIAESMNAFEGTQDWSVGNVPAEYAEMTKLVSFEGDKCWDGLTTIAETFEVEWWTEENGNMIWIHFGKLEVGTAEIFKRGDVITSLPAKKGDDAEYGTRFFVFGSTRNLPDDYGNTEQDGITNHVSQKRLHLPSGYKFIDARDNLTKDEIVEQIVIFDNIFPKNTETVTGIETIPRLFEGGDSDTQETFDAYVMKCANTPFLPSDIIVGETLQAQFTSGSLMGRKFDLAIIDDKNNPIDPATWEPADGFNKKFEIIHQEEESGGDKPLIIPNASLHPKEGDTFVLIGVRLPEARKDAAEQELLKAGLSYAKEHSTDTTVYDCPTNPVYCTENDKNYDLGQRVLLDDERFGPDGRASRIQAYEKKLYNEYIATYTVGDNTAYSRFGAIEKDVKAAAYSERFGISTTTGGIYLIRSQYDYTPPSDTNAYSAMASDARYLNRKTGGKVDGPITVNEIKSSDYAGGEGMVGAGYRIYRDENGNAVGVFDKVVVRKEAQFNELVINQISFKRGETVFTQGGFTITRVEEPEGADYFRCYYDNANGARFAGIKVGDQVRGQRYDANYNAIASYFWRLCVGVGEDYVDLSKSDCDAGSGAPQENDDCAQFGNRTDKTRQSAVVIDPANGGRIEIYAGIDSYNLSGCNMTGMGTDATTGEAYLYGYGNVYFGDRNSELGYLKFDKKNGLQILGNLSVRSKIENQDGTYSPLQDYLDSLVGDAVKSDAVSNIIKSIAKSYADEALRAAEAAQQTADNLKDFTDAAFADGIIDRAEAVAIEKYKNSVNETKKAVDASYATVYNNSLLSGTPKSNLQAAKSAFDTAVANLLASIATASDDGISTAAEKADVDAKYATFNNAYSTYTTRLEEAQAAMESAINTTAQGAYQLSEQIRQTLDNLANVIIPDLQDQIDGQIVSWTGDDMPTLNNYPASDWKTDTEKNRHINDYYDRKVTASDGTVSYERYKFSKSGNTYTWERISDSGAAQALAEAREALGMADSKSTIFFGDSTPSVPYNVNDVWIKVDGSIYICNADRAVGDTASLSDWQLVNDAQARLRQMSSDGVISREEKAVLRNRLAQIENEFAQYQSDAAKYGISITSLTSAKNNLVNFLTGTVAVNNDTDTTLTTQQRTDYNTYFANYDAEVSRFGNLVADAVAKQAVDDIEIGGRNLLLNSNVRVENDAYDIANYYFGNEKPEDGETYTLTLKGQLGSNRTDFRIYNSGWNVGITALIDNKDGTYSRTFNWTNTSGSNIANNTYIQIFQFPSTGSGKGVIEWIKLEKGNIASDWTPAPEDVQAEIDKVKNDVAGLDYIKKALGESTAITGGLVLTSLVQLGTTVENKYTIYSGINGVIDSTKKGSGIATWFGGDMIDGEVTNWAGRYAQSLFRFDGSGYLAGGNITWDINGYGGLGDDGAGGHVFMWDEKGVRLSDKIQIGASGNMLSMLMQSVILFNQMFELDTTSVAGKTVIHAKYGFYSDGFITALGVNPNATSGGGTSYNRLDSWGDYVAAKSTWVLSAGLGYDLNTRVISNTNNISSLMSRVATLESSGGLGGGEVLDFVYSGLGNVVTNVTKSGTTVTVTKGLTALTAADNIASATRLQDSYSLWGQTFYGNNVSGDLTGVGNIIANGVFTTHTSLNEYYGSVFAAYSNTLSSGKKLVFQMGKSDSQYNVLQICYNHVEDGSTNNYIGFGFHSVQPFVAFTAGKKVGINTTTPSYELHVVGTVYATSFVKSGGTSSQFLKADGSIDSNVYLTSLALGGLSNVSLSSPATGQVLQYNGSNWVNATISAGGGGETLSFTDSGNGNVVTAVTKSGSTVTVTKGITALTSHQSIYAATFSAGSFSAKTYTPNSSAQTINIPTQTSHLTNNSGFITSSSSISGNAGTATKLANSRTLWQQSFDGSGNVKGNLVLYDGDAINADSSKLYFRSRGAQNNGPYIQGLSDGGYDKLRIAIYQSNSSSYTHSYTEVVSIRPSGDVGIGTTSPSYKFHVNGAAGATAWNNTSDARLKNILHNVNLDIRRIANAPAVSFRWKSNGDVGAGTIAQYWQHIIPEAVTADNNGILSIQYGNIALVSVISVARKVVDHERRIAELERKNAELEKDNSDLREIVERLQAA